MCVAPGLSSVFHVTQYDKCVTNINGKFRRHITVTQTQNNSQCKNREHFHYLKKKMQKTFISPYLDLENSYSFNLQNLGKHFKCQNTHAECDLAYKHQRSVKFTKILGMCKVHLFLNYIQFERRTSTPKFINI